ncbi:MAG TPA: preprotein translocase subunit YajC [Candidatus Limnocylindria bacterium]|nr:preprotein translocase subunit YajC [Candidatus Limnocylindria bacterium]
MWSDAWAQSGGSSPPDPLIGTLIQLGQFVPLLLILYFLLIRPQQQKQKTMEKMLKALKKGDRVLTTGGIYGIVVGVDDAKAVVRIAEDIKVEFAKNAIVQVLAEEKK